MSYSWTGHPIFPCGIWKTLFFCLLAWRSRHITSKGILLADIDRWRQVFQCSRTCQSHRQRRCLCIEDHPVYAACSGYHPCHFAWDFEKEYFNGNIVEKLAWKLGRAKEIFWSYLKLLHLAVWIQIPDRFFLCQKSKGQVLWVFLTRANFLRFFQGSSMVIFSVFDSNPRLLFLRILRSKVWFFRIFPQFFIKVFAKVGWEILCFLWHKTENLALLHRVFL